MWKLLNFARQNSKFMISNVSKKKFKYSFQTGVANKFHPKRRLLNGTDSIYASENLIILADHGNIENDQIFEQDIDEKIENLFKIINLSFQNQTKKYIQDLPKLIFDAINICKIGNVCTLTVCALNTDTGDIQFYYVGDNLYGIFKKDNVIMIEGIYQKFNKPYRIGQHPGFIQTYSRKQIDNDLIVFGSNGLWDNLNLEHIHYLVRGPYSYKQISFAQNDSTKAEERQTLSLGVMAQKLCTLASIYSCKGEYESPFFKKAKENNLNYPKEGFLDDVSVVLAKLKKDIYID